MGSKEFLTIVFFSGYNFTFTVNTEPIVFSFLLSQRKNNLQHAVLAGTAVRSIGTARRKPLVFGKGRIKVVFFFLAGYHKKLEISQAENYASYSTSNMVLWISPTPLSR